MGLFNRALLRVPQMAQDDDFHSEMDDPDVLAAMHSLESNPPGNFVTGS